MNPTIVLYAVLLLPAAVYKALHKRSRAYTRGGHQHGEWLAIDRMAYTSRMRTWNPVLKALLCVLTLSLCIVLDSPHVSAAVLFVMAFLAVEVGGLPMREYIGTLCIPLVFLLFSTAAVAVEYSAHPAGEFRLGLGAGFLYTSRALLIKSACLTLKVLACISALDMLILTTPSSEILLVLKKARVPRMLVDLMHMIYRYIFILLDVSAKMRRAAQSRLGYRDIRTSWYSFGSIASNLLVLSLKRAGAYYDAMEARCYSGELAFIEDEKPAQKGQIIFAGLFLLYLPLMRYLAK